MSSRSAIVNTLTFSRLPLIVAWAALAVVQEFTQSVTLAAAAVLAIVASGLTDWFDGALARRWQVVSALGKMADPLMDKVFYLFAFPTLVWLAAHQGESVHAVVLLVFTVTYLFRDTWVTFLRSVGALYGADVSARFIGKLRTALSFPAAGWIYIYLVFHRHLPAPWPVRWLASCYAVEAFLFVLTLVTFFTYTRVFWPQLRRAIFDRQR